MPYWRLKIRLTWQTTTPLPSTDSGECTLCAPIPSAAERDTIPTVTIFPMKKEKKVSRFEDEVVCVTEWVCNGERSWLFVKRPEKGE
jgi:A/G-specific adenine glycosylase